MKEGHYRPNSYGELWDDLQYQGHYFNARENGSWASDILTAIEGWYSEKEFWIGEKDGDGGHYWQMIWPENKYVGTAGFNNPNVDTYKNGISTLFAPDQNQEIGYINKETGEIFWQDPYTMPAGDTAFSGLSGENTQVIEINNTAIDSFEVNANKTMIVDGVQYFDIYAVAKMVDNTLGTGITTTSKSFLPGDSIDEISSSDDTIADVGVANIIPRKGSAYIHALKPGKETITFKAAGKTDSFDVTILPQKEISSLDQLEDITVDSGEEPWLPSYVKAFWNDGTETNESITWPSVLPDTYKSRSVTSYTINGYVQGASDYAVQKINVNEAEIVYVRDTYRVLTDFGVRPSLPATAEVKWSNGEKEEMPIDWNEIVPEEYTKHEGNYFSVSGKVADQTVICDVYVKPAKKTWEFVNSSESQIIPIDSCKEINTENMKFIVTYEDGTTEELSGEKIGISQSNADFGQ